MKNNTIRALLTAASCIGVAATGLMAVRDTKKSEKLPEYDGEEDLKLYFKRKIRDYIPTIAVGGATVGCIITNHVLTAKELKALTTVAASTAALLEKYKVAIEEEFGREGAEKVVRNVANRRFKAVGEFSGTDLLVEEGTELYYMEFNDTFFRSSNSKVMKALYEFNKEFNENMKVSVSRLEELLEIEPNIKFCDGDYGFSYRMLEDNTKWIDFDIVEAETEEGEVFKILYFSREAGLYDIDAGTYVDLD